MLDRLTRQPTWRATLALAAAVYGSAVAGTVVVAVVVWFGSR